MLIAAGVWLLFLGARDVLRFPPGATGSGARIRPFCRYPHSAPQIRRGDPIAKLIIPRLATELYVVEGDHDSELRLGPGHLKGTAMPGAQGNCVIAGHRDTHFRVLKDIRKGDDIVLETQDGRYLYRVKNTRVVSASNTEPLQPTGTAELNLITCFPFFYVGSSRSAS